MFKGFGKIHKGAKPPAVLFARRMEQGDIDAQCKAYGGNAVCPIAARKYAPTPDAGLAAPQRPAQPQMLGMFLCTVKARAYAMV